MMLSRNAEGLYWLARYMQRADSTARMIEVAYRMSMIPSLDGGFIGEWNSILAASGATELYQKKYEKVTADSVSDFLLFDEDNASSVYCCISQARQNARSFRTTLTTEVWDSVNSAYLYIKKLKNKKNRTENLPNICDQIKHDYVLMRGAYISGQLEHEGFDFFHAGCYLERADSTARILDVKYYVLLPTGQAIGGQLDHSQWSRLLRAMSGWRAFHYCYGADYTYKNIANFLILETRYPRAILHCRRYLLMHLERLSSLHQKVGSATELTREIMQTLKSASIETIIKGGLHEFLTQIVQENNRLNDCIADDYLFEGH